MNNKHLAACLISLAASVSAHAAVALTNVCPATTIPNAAATVTGTAGNFVIVTFTPRCSNNVVLSYSEPNATFVAVGTTSLKGKNAFAGSSMGGGVVPVGTQCIGTPCVAADATAGVTAAALISS